MAGAIVQQPPIERKGTVDSKSTNKYLKFAFFDGNSALLYNISIEERIAINFAEFPFAKLPLTAEESPRGHALNPGLGLTSRRMGIIPNRG